MKYTCKQNIGKHYWWNAWVGCTPVSTACRNCYVKTPFCNEFNPIPDIDYPFGTVLDVCLKSDFFIEDADHLRQQAWEEIKSHPNYIFLIITKRASRIKDCLPPDWGDGYPNVILSVTAENQALADERIPHLLDIPCHHRWISVCPMIRPIRLSQYLSTGLIECVEACGEKGHGGTPRQTKYEWVEYLSHQCKAHDVRFSLMFVGHNFKMPDGTIMKDNTTCYNSRLADSLNLTHFKKVTFKLADGDITL